MSKKTLFGAIAILAILAGFAAAQSWEYTITVDPDLVGMDHNLIFGLTSGGTDGFDAGLDVPYFTPPDGKGAFFPINDPAHPSYVKLSKDVKGSGPEDYVYWTINLEGYYHVDPRFVRWDTLSLPTDGFFDIAAKSLADAIEDIDPAAWVNMATAEEIEFSPVENVVVRYLDGGLLDSLPPYATGFIPSDGYPGAETNTNIVFDIVDNGTGVDDSSIEVYLWYNDDTTTMVDVTSMIAWEPLVGGYRGTLSPLEGEWPESTMISYSVQACDLADPANCMATPAIVSFTTASTYPDTGLPYFENWYPVDGDTMVDADTCVRLVIKDSDSGIDSSTIELTFDGAVIDHADYDIYEIGSGSGWYAITYCPAMAWNYLYAVSVTAFDNAGNSNMTSWSFRTANPPDLSEFSYNLQVLSIDGADTSRTNLYMGTDLMGTENWDAGLDVPQFLFPGEPRGYFPINDPTAPPGTEALSSDIRSTERVVHDWIVDVGYPDEELILKWDNESLPLSEEATFQFAVVDSGMYPTEYSNMSLFSSADFGPTEVVYIRMIPGTVDTMPPVIRNISHEGPGIYPTEPLEFEIVDIGSGVDATSFSLIVNSSLVPEADITSYAISGGYHYSYIPDGGWADVTNYYIEVDACDLASPENCMHHEWNFTTTSGGCGPEFNLPITFTWGTGPGESEGIVLGMDNEATPGFDEGLDLIMPPSIGAGFYFASSDPAPRDKLGTDYRNNCDLGSIWKVGVNSPEVSVNVDWSAGAPIFGEDDWKLYYTVQSITEPAPDRPVSDPAAWMGTLDTLEDIVYNSATEILYFSYDLYGEAREMFDLYGNVNVFGTEDNSGVNVQITAGPSRVTDSLGDYLFEDLLVREDPYIVTFTLAEYTTVVETVTSPDSGGVELNITMYPPCQSVSGNITLEGSATFGVGVMLYEGDFTTLFGEEVTASTGNYEFPCVPPGDYCMRVSYPGYAPWDTCFSVSTSDITIDYDVVPVLVNVCGVAHLDGVAAEDIAISVDGTPTTVVSDASGNYCVDIYPGLHTICGNYPGYEEDCQTVNVPDTSTSLGGIDLDLTAGTVDLTVMVDLGCEPSDESGASVTLVGVGTQTTPTSGMVRFEGLAHGMYTVNVEAEYHKSAVIDSIDLVMSDTVAVTLCCLDPVTGFSVEGEHVMRPTTEPLSIDLSWTEPDSVCSVPDSYYIYRADFPFYDAGLPGVEELDVVARGITTYSDETVEDGAHYYYDIKVKYAGDGEWSPLAGNQDTMSSTHADTTDVLIVDWDNGATPLVSSVGVGEWWESMLTSSGLGVPYSVAITDDDATNPLEGYNLDDYTLVIVALGINDADNTLLPGTALSKLDAYRATSGKKLIVEGPDFGEDYDGDGFFDNLGLNLAGPGDVDTNVTKIWASSELWSNLWIEFDYAAGSQADRYVDILAAVGSNTQAIGWDQDTIPRIFYYNEAGASQALIGAAYLGGIVDGTAAIHTQLRAASGYLNKLGIPNTGIENIEGELPTEFGLVSAYPNPFNPVTTIKFELPENCEVELGIYDVTGKRMATVISRSLKSGVYEATWDASGLPSGVYFARLTTGNKAATQKLMLLK